jgi:hypothetical protein
MPLSRSLVSRTFAVGNVLLAGLVLWAAFSGLTARDLWVDGPAVVLALMLLSSSAGLLRNAPWALRMLRACASIELLIGFVAIAALALSASYLVGTHGDLGRSGALTMTLVLALMLPYLVLYPVLQLIWVYARQHAPASR